MVKDQNCIISEVTFKNKEVPPVIAYFENGDLKPEVISQAACGIYRDRHAPEEYVVAVCTGESSLYLGNEPPQEPYRTLLAIQENNSNKVRLLEVDSVSLRLAPTKTLKESSLDLKQTTYSDLYKTFGSKKIKRQTEQIERMQINIDTITDRLTNTVASVSVEDELPRTDPNEYSGVGIPCNRNASTVEDVYKLEDIILPEELDSIQEAAETALSNSPETNAEWYTNFFCDNLKNLPVDDKLHRTKILLYAECLVQFVIRPCYEILKKGYSACPFSQTINEKILENFTVKTVKGRSRPVSMKDKVLCSIIVLCLIAHKFVFDSESLCVQTKTTRKRFLELCHVIGAVPCVGDKTKKSTKIVLKLPLPKVTMPVSKKKKRNMN